MAGPATRWVSEMLCGRCSTVLDNCQAPRKGRKGVEYSIVDIFQSENCPLCRLIIQILPQGSTLVTGQADVDFARPNCLVKSEPDKLEVFYAGKQRGYILPASHPSLQRSTNHQYDVPTAAQSPTVPLHTNLVQRWVEECNTTHSKRHDRYESPRLREPIDIILVDVLEYRIVRASSYKKFLALSYVWGQVPMFVTSTANRRQLEEKNGLIPYLAEIPQLVRDAIELVQNLKERYLWVDALCIEQDHAQQKHAQIAQMDIIYSHAFMTIVAIAAKDADSPLPGVRPGTRTVTMPWETIRDERWTIQPSHFSVAFQDAIYETRGWTMQERLFSRRCLYLTEFAAYLNCCQSIVRSDNDYSERYDLGLALQISGNFSHFLDIFCRPPFEYINAPWDAYKKLVTEFTKRKLSYSTDNLNAFAGISAALQEQLGSRFTCGLPDCFLDVAMLWTPESLLAPMARNSNFASWSWAGWSGPARINGALYENMNPAYPDFTRSHLESKIDSVLMYHRTAPRHLVPHSLDEHKTHAQSGGLNVKEPAWDILEFSAWCANAESFVIAPHGPSMAIFDMELVKCGILFASPDAPIFQVHDNVQCEIVLLSKNLRGRPYKTFIQITRAEETDPSADSTSSDYPSMRLWDLKRYPQGEGLSLNVMLVANYTDRTERLCIGCIHVSAWNAVPLEKKTVTLS